MQKEIESSLQESNSAYLLFCGHAEQTVCLLFSWLMGLSQQDV